MTIKVNKSGANSRLISLAPMNENTTLYIRKRGGYNKIYQNDELIDILEEGYSLNELQTIASEFGAKCVQI